MSNNQKKMIQMLAMCVVICLAVGLLSRIQRSRQETLKDYADKNPEIAYLKHDTVSGNNTEASGTLADIEAALPDTKATKDPLAERPESNLTGANLNKSNAWEKAIIYSEGFYYEELSDNLKRYITGISYPAEDQKDMVITYDDLRYMHIWHYDFDGKPAEGELICNVNIADDLIEIFHALYVNEYQIQSVRLIDEYDGDDLKSMEANNTSCFNYRVVEGTTSISKHAYGFAIDINPLYNPYITYNKDGSYNVSPEEGASYADRSGSFPYKIDENDLCYKLFKEHGFTWGGDWNSVKDYQHFQKVAE